MTKRLQVLLDDVEMRDLQRIARAERVTVAEWVRQTLRTARRRQPEGAVDEKVAAIRRAAGHAFPTAEIDDMLSEIERGYTGGLKR